MQKINSKSNTRKCSCNNFNLKVLIQIFFTFFPSNLLFTCLNGRINTIPFYNNAVTYEIIQE